MVIAALSMATIPLLAYYSSELRLDSGEILGAAVLAIAFIFVGALVSFEISYQLYNARGE